LRAQLNLALAALARSNTAVACQSLQYFITLVRLQRGHQLTLAQADYLMSQAGDICLLIGCP
jgi:hypothetical protein